MQLSQQVLARYMIWMTEIKAKELIILVFFFFFQSFSSLSKNLINISIKPVSNNTLISLPVVCQYKMQDAGLSTLLPLF